MAYNTTPFHGKTARVEKNNTAMDFTEGWSITAEVAFDDITDQGDSWEDQVAGIAKWSGNFKGLVVLGNTEQKAFVDNIVAASPGTKLTDVKFLLDAATNAFTGNLHITKYSVETAKSGAVRYTFDFKGSGAMSVTDAA